MRISAPSPGTPSRSVSRTVLPCLLLAVPAVAQDPPWRISGPLCTPVSAVSFATADSKLAYAATVTRERSTVFVSNDGGESWEPTARQPRVRFEGIFDIAVHPDDERTVWVAADGVYKSDDGGLTWDNLSRDLPRPRHAFDLTVHPEDPDVVFVNSDSAIWRSTNGGREWRAISPPGFWLRYAVHPSDPDVLWISGYNGVLRSTTGGRRWSATSGLPRTGGPLAIDPTRRSTVYTAVGADVYKTTNGRRWEKVGSHGAFSGDDPVFLSVDPSRPSDLVLGSSYGGSNRPALWKSTDGGGSWEPEDLADGSAIDFARHPGEPRLTLIGATSGLFRSERGGSEPLRSQTGLFGGEVDELAVGPAPATTPRPAAYAATSCGIFARAHRRREWRLVDPDFKAQQVSLGISPADPRLLYRGARSQGALFYTLERSADGGATWEIVSVLGGGDRVRDIQASPADPMRVYASVANRGLYVSVNGGLNWGVANSTGPSILTPHPTRPETIFGATSAGVVRSEDGGETWRQVTDFSVRDLAIDAARPSTMFALGESLYRSGDGGDSWKRIRADLPAGGDHHSLVVDGLGGGTLFLGSTDGVYRSTNGGRRWKSFNKGLPRKLEVSILPHRRLHLTSEGELLLASSEGVYVTRAR